MRLTTQIPSHDKNRLRCSTPAPECSNLFRLIKMLQSTVLFFSGLSLSPIFLYSYAHSSYSKHLHAKPPAKCKTSETHPWEY